VRVLTPPRGYKSRRYGNDAFGLRRAFHPSAASAGHVFAYERLELPKVVLRGQYLEHAGEGTGP
jgi:hypothetical protein